MSCDFIIIARAQAVTSWPLTLQQAAWIPPPIHAVDSEAMIDVPRLRRYRQNRLRQQEWAVKWASQMDDLSG